MEYRKDVPRSESQVVCQCFGDPVLFGKWEEMPILVQAHFVEHGPIPCSGSGNTGVWCDGCRFGSIEEI